MPMRSSQQLLDEFRVKVEEIPVVVRETSTIRARNPTMQNLADRLGLNAPVDEIEIARPDYCGCGAGRSGRGRFCGLA